LETFSFFGYLSTGGFTGWSLPHPLARLIFAIERLPPQFFWRKCAIKALIVAEKT